MNKIILFLNLVSLFCLAQSQVNYCSTSLCPAGVTHIACSSGAWSSACPAVRSMVTFNKAIIVYLHNYLRNLLALGKVTGYSQASRMATMQWDNQLAYVASFNVKQCEMKHDMCRNTPTFTKSGQNLALMSYSGDASRLTNDYLIKTLINLWWSEYKNGNMTVIKSYPSSWNGSDIGHFTAMARESNIRVGCAAARYNSSGMNNFLMACNYATTNIIGYPVYRVGAATTGCKTGKNPSYVGLCSVSETYSL